MLYGLCMEFSFVQENSFIKKGKKFLYCLLSFIREYFFCICLDIKKSLINVPIYNNLGELLKLYFYFIQFHRSSGMRIFMAIFFLWTYMISIGYRGILPSFLTVTVLPRPMDSLQELANTVSTRLIT